MSFVGGLFRAFRLRYRWRGPWFFAHRFRGVHFTRLMCGDGRTGAGVHFAECACRPELAAVKCSVAHLGNFGCSRHFEEELETKAGLS